MNSIKKKRDKSIVKVARKSHKPWYKDKDHIQLSLMSFIPALLVFIFSYIPIFGIIIAFKNYRYDLGIFGSQWVGLKNFEAFVKSDSFSKLIVNTVGNNMLFIIFGTITAVLVALLLFEIVSRRTTKIIQTIVILPNFVSWVLVSYLVYIFLAPDSGVLNKILNTFGISMVDWYATPSVWPVILTIVFVWKHFGMDSIMYYAALMGIDQSIIEAAEIDGANKIQRTWHIVIPSILPLMIILVIMKIGNIFRADFGLFYNVTRNVGLLYETTDVFDTYIFRMVREIGDMGLSSAAGLIQSVVGFIVVIIANKLSKKIDPNYGLF